MPTAIAPPRSRPRPHPSGRRSSVPRAAPALVPVLVTVLVTVLVVAFLAATPAAAGDWSRFEVETTGSYAWRYLPDDLAEPAPAVVFLHGSGVRPEDWLNLLAPVADEVGTALLLPASLSPLGFGVGADDATVRDALAILGDEVALDPTRTAIAGHSSGGAFATVLALSAVTPRFSAVFSLSAPYRTVLAVADVTYTAPVRLYYGSDDPNYRGAHAEAIIGQLDRLGVPQELEVGQGFGHSSWPETTLPDGFRFLLEQRYGTPGGCLPSATRLCLRDGRFAVEATWRDQRDRRGDAEAAAAQSDDSGLFFFFRPDNWELQVKVIDGCSYNGHYWVLAAATTNVEYHLTVTDLATGERFQFDNPLGRDAPAVTAVTAFSGCP